MLETDVEAVIAQLRQEQEKLLRTHDVIPVAPVTCSAHLELVGQSDAHVMECVTEDDTARDAFAALKSNVADMLDIWNEVDPSHHRDWVKDAFEQVEELNRLGLVVCVGKAKRAFRTGAARLELNTLYVVAWPKGQEKAFIAFEKVG